MKLRIWSWVCGGLIVVAVLILLVVVYREWFATEPCGMESRSTTLRNLFLVVGGLIAIVIATWRNLISHHGLLNERFQRGSEMLGSPVLSVRLGGIYALQRLAEDELKQYHVQVMRLLCAFVRNPTKDEDDKTKPPGTEKEPNIKDYKVREDVQETMTAIGARSDVAVELEKKADPPFLPDLSGAYLPFVRLFKANLTDADLGNEAFPWLSAREIEVAGVPTRALRVSYVGELGWELHHPPDRMEALYDAVIAAGAEYGIADFGVYAVNALRMEKAYKAWGLELTTEITPIEAGLERFLKVEPPYMGKSAVEARAGEELDTRLIYLAVDAEDADAHGNEPVCAEGRVVGLTTSGGYGHSVGQSLAFAYVEPAHAAPATELEVSILGRGRRARVLDRAIYDPGNERLRA